MKKLTAKQQRFVELYDGNGTQTAKRAGYAGNDVTLANVARNLLRKTEIAQAIKARESKVIRPHIWTRDDRQAFWTQVASDEGEDMQNRLKAADSLAKSEGDFIKKIEVSGKLTLEQLVAGEFDDDSEHH